MNCQELIELVSDFLNDELAAEQRLLVEQHLGGCRDCHVSIELYQATIRVTQALGRCGCDPLPVTFEARLRAVVALHWPQAGEGGS